jgi:hypothetical protein
MAVDESLRRRIHHKLEALIGTEEADALVTHTFPAPGQEVATKDDLRVLAAELRTEMAAMRGELLGENGRLGGEIEKVRGEIHAVVVSQTRWMIGFIMTWSAVVIAGVRLLL